MNIVDQLKEVVSLNWTDEDYGQSKHKADYKKQLANIYQLDSFNNIEHNKTKILIPENEVMYIVDRNGEQKKFICCSSVKISNNSVFFSKKSTKKDEKDTVDTHRYSCTTQALQWCKLLI